MAQDQKVTLTFKMSDDTEKSVEFVVPAGQDGAPGFLPGVPANTVPVMITPEDFITAVETAMNDRTVPTVVTQDSYYTSFNGITQYCYITKYPGNDGHYVLATGPAQLDPLAVGTFMYWVPASDALQVATVFETKAMPAMAFVSSQSFEGQGTEDAPFTVRVSSAEGNILQDTPEGLFAAASGGGLPGMTSTVIDTVTPMADVQAAMLALIQNPATAAANTQWNHVTYPQYADDGQVRLTVIPAETGKYLFIGGDLNYPGQNIASMAWASDDGSQTSTMFESFRTSPQVDESLTGSGLWDALRVRLSTETGNGLSLKDDGLFAVAGGLPALPAAPLGDQITPQEFDDKVSQLLNSTGPSGSPNAEHYGMNVGNYGGFHAYLVSIPVPGEGFYVFASGYIQENPPTKLELQAYVSTAGGVISDPTYIVYDTVDMTSNLKALDLYSSDSTVKTTQDADNLNNWNLQAKTLTRGTGGGNWSFGYPDNKAAANACGHMGTGVYWKVTISLSNAGAGNTNVPVQVWVNNLPCLEDGTPVSHRVIVDYAYASSSSATPTAAVWLVCDVPPTHLIDITTGTITQIYRGAGSGTTGLPEYPVAPEGQFSNEPAYSRQYFYDAFTA